MIAMIKRAIGEDLDLILQLINESAKVYKGHIPSDRWHEPYMSLKELRKEIDQGVSFYSYFSNRRIVAVMGIQKVKDVTLIRHAYVSKGQQRRGIGSKLLKYLLEIADTSTVLVGTWEKALWAIDFYERNGFSLVEMEEKNRLLMKYWDIPKRQVETSVVLKLNKS